MWPNEFRVLCPNGLAKWADVIGATTSSLASADAHGAPMLVDEPGNANTSGGLLARQQNVAQNTAVQNLVAPLSAEIARSTTFER